MLKCRTAAVLALILSVPVASTGASKGIKARVETGAVVPCGGGYNPPPCEPPSVCESDRLWYTCQTPGYKCVAYAED